MTSRPIKMAVVLLLGFVLTWQGVFTSSVRKGATAQGAQQRCCYMGCDHQHCATPACCVKRDTPSAPVAPASLPSTAKDQFQALAVSGVPALSLPLCPARCFSSCPAFSVLVTAVPLFQRDCAWLI